MKRRQFAKMQKALFADERIKKIAENPGNQAFLKTIEDRGSDDEMDMIDAAPEPVDVDESQSQTDPGIVPDSQPAQSRLPLRSGGSNRPPAPMRRTKDGKKPSNIGEIRESLSTLLGDPSASIIPATEVDSDSEDDERPGSSRSNKENHNPGTNPRRTHGPVIDRRALNRQGSSSLTSTTGRMAFAVPSSANSSFKVPALLRRATTNSVMSTSSSGTSSSSTTPSTTTGGLGSGKIRKGATKTSGINYFARENERRAALAESEKRRAAKKWKGAEKRAKAVGGLFGAGRFE
jgi:mediator of replication checkpoint protein 1